MTLQKLEALADMCSMAHGLIQEAKGVDGPKGGFVTDHLDAAENWLDEIEELAAAALRVAGEVREDAARYRWLRDHSCPPHNFYISVPDEFHGVRYAPADVDAYIDEALAKRGGKIVFEVAPVRDAGHD